MELYNYITTPNGVNICYVDISHHEFSADMSRISGYRKNKLKKIKTEKGRKASLGVEMALISLVSKLELTDTFPLEYEADDKGKPIFKDKQGIYLSLSHSGNLAACAIAYEPVGIDVQEIKRMNISVAHRYFTDTEFRQSDGSDKSFIRIWSRKEAAAKAEGTGISIGLSGFDVSSDNVMINGELYYVEDIAVQDENYCMATAVKITSL